MPSLDHPEIPVTNSTNYDDCNNFRAEIVSRYRSLISDNRIRANGLGVSIEDIFLKYIPNGTSFDDAEDFLSKAEFDVSKHPGFNAIGNRPDRYDVYAESSNVILSTSPGTIGLRVVVTLRPTSPDKYDAVASSTASISITAL